MRGKPIKSMARMMQLARYGRAVLFCHKVGGGYRTSAAWVANYPARTLHYQIVAGYYFEYIPKKSTRKTQATACIDKKTAVQ